MKIYESSENYLETILMLTKKNGQVRSIDIANELNYSKPSVSHAMKLLRENGFALMDEDGYIKLTTQGKEIADRMYERHIFLTNFLTAIGVDKEIAAEDACRIEHVISQESFDKMKKFMDTYKF